MRHNNCVSKCPDKEKKTNEFYSCATTCYEEDFLILNVMEKSLIAEAKYSLKEIM